MTETVYEYMIPCQVCGGIRTFTSKKLLSKTDLQALENAAPVSCPVCCMMREIKGEKE